AGYRHWLTCLAIPVGRAEAEGNLAATSGDGLDFYGVDLRCGVGAFSGAAARGGDAGTSADRRIFGGGGSRADGAFRRVSERCQRRLTSYLKCLFSVI